MLQGIFCNIKKLRGDQLCLCGLGLVQRRLLFLQCYSSWSGGGGRAKSLTGTPSGRCYLHTYISIKKGVQGEGKLAGLAALSTGNYKTKLAVVVDDDIDVYDEEEVLWAIATRVAWDSNVLIMPGVTGNQLDPVAYNETRLERGQMNTKIVIDATKPVGSPFLTRVTPPQELWESMNLEDYLAK